MRKIDLSPSALAEIKQEFATAKKPGGRPLSKRALVFELGSTIERKIDVEKFSYAEVADWLAAKQIDIKVNILRAYMHQFKAKGKKSATTSPLISPASGRGFVPPVKSDQL